MIKFLLKILGIGKRVGFDMKIISDYIERRTEFTESYTDQVLGGYNKTQSFSSWWNIHGQDMMKVQEIIMHDLITNKINKDEVKYARKFVPLINNFFKECNNNVLKQQEKDKMKIKLKGELL